MYSHDNIQDMHWMVLRKQPKIVRIWSLVTYKNWIFSNLIDKNERNCFFLQNPYFKFKKMLCWKDWIYKQFLIEETQALQEIILEYK